MVTSCSAYGCTYRHKKGDKIGLYRFPKDENLLKLWLSAINRGVWKSSTSSRICGKHFLSGRPSRDKNDPDYVPSIFSFVCKKKFCKSKKNTVKVQKKNSKRKVSQKETLHDTLSEICRLRKLEQNPNEKSMPLVPVKAGERLIKPAPFIHFVGKCESMKENNVEKNTSIEASNNNISFLKNSEIRPAVPQHAWLLNFFPAKNDPEMPVKIASVSSVNENHTSPAPNTSDACEGSAPVCVESSVTIDDNSRLSAYSDESTLTADSPIPDEEAISLNAESSMVANESSDVCNVEPSSVASKDSTACKVESSVVAKKDSTVCDAESSVVASKDSSVDNKGCISEDITNDAQDDLPTSTSVSTKEPSDCDYSNFMWSHDDTKEVLAIKLETMLAINMSLREKVKFYQNKCKLYENELSNFKKLDKKSLNIVTPKNSKKCIKIKQEPMETT